MGQDETFFSGREMFRIASLFSVMLKYFYVLAAWCTVFLQQKFVEIYSPKETTK